MKKYLKQMQLHADYGKSAMESGDHSKNGASPKSLMSRNNFFIIMAVVLTLFCPHKIWGQDRYLYSETSYPGDIFVDINAYGNKKILQVKK
ncbi:MAG: hypothetical protein LBL13_12065 [Bacteroidales bacterium]|jgi:hypothetical protein|nr:hypothetical protein [Bacteroidales bacterium]